MDSLIIQGPCKLRGEVEISSSKNAALPIMAACILSPIPVTIDNLPKLQDIRTMQALLEDMGVLFHHGEKETYIDASKITQTFASYDKVKTMRAGVLVLGPLLARFKEAKVSLPGGCAIGARPVDIHLKALEAMGAEITINSGYIQAKTKGLMGTKIVFPFPSVGATENTLMAASMAIGQSVIENAAKEPEIVDLCQFLIKLGAGIEGVGTSTLKVTPIKEVRPTQHQIIPDRIEALTFVIAAAITHSEITLKNVIPSHLDSLLYNLEMMGVKVVTSESSIRVLKCHDLKGIEVETSPYPGFPTDGQAQMMTLMTKASSPSVITEQIFENRFMHVPELQRMGAKISLKGPSALVDKSELTGTKVMCTDLRASAALVLAALAAQGESEILRIYHLDRGYESIELKLSQLGAIIQRKKNPWP